MHVAPSTSGARTRQPAGRVLETARTGLETHKRSVEAFNAHDADAVSMAYAADAIVHDPLYPEPIRGRERIRDEYAAFFRSHPDIRTTIRNVIDAGDVVCYEMVLTGTHTGPLETPQGLLPPSGGRLDLPIAAFADVDEAGQYRELRRYFDPATLLRQLGLA
jgi:steroid delta-isomerase-like uncharacterized protein